MASVTFSVPDEIKSQMKEFSWVNWSESAREELIKRDKRIKLFEELDKLTKNSTLTDEDCLELGKLAKKGIWEKLKRQL